MTNPSDASQPTAPPNHVWVYGNDHSPWVQAVLLGLHQKKIAHTLLTVPPVSVFRESGILMPAAKIDDGPWLLDSEKILVEIGFSEVDADARRALLSVFGDAAMRRTDDAWNFWSRFSFARDGHPMLARRLWNHFWRPFSIFYFFMLIRVGRRTRPMPSPERLASGFAFFQDRLRPDAKYLGGETPDTVDLQLFGLVQMCASIPVPSLAVLREDSDLRALRRWIEAMQHCFSDYAHLYSATEFEPKRPEIARASLLERFFYWSGAVLMWIAFPITLPCVLFFVRRVRKKRLLRT